MAVFRALKSSLRSALQGDDWLQEAETLMEAHGRHLVGPLFSFLLLGGAMTGRAAYVLGQVVAAMADERMEDGRVIMRRLMWHMNEESGNIGWGIPEAMAECLVAHDGLAREFHRILVSYIRDRDGDSNFCDHAPLRRHCFWAVGRFLEGRPDFIKPEKQGGHDMNEAVLEALHAGLRDEDAQCRAYAAWALSVYAKTWGRGLCAEHIYDNVQTLLGEEDSAIALFEDGILIYASTHSIAQGLLVYAGE